MHVSAAHGDAFLVEDSENLDTCEGAGTIGLELLDGFNRIDAILLALGGGALATIVTTDRTDTIADGVAGRFPIAAVLVDLLAIADHVPLVEEESILAGMQMLYRHAALVVEPSAALGVAAILEDPLRYRGKRVAVVMCGSNVLSDSFSAWMQE